ncbi:MAG: Piwi domain-containing protein [Dysgonomonas sp.]|nr:Piwi domain-containing protein [Dysgonomonas sp.]
MRGLVNNRPYDVNLNGIIHSKEINLSIICGKPYSSVFHDFLSCLQSRHQTGNINPDYLIEYPGFSSIYNIPINIPSFDNNEKWIDIDFKADNELETHENAIKLARLITTKIDQIVNTQTQNTIVIFIPKEWLPFESYINQNETFDLHDYIKAFSASRGVSTQLIREETLDDDLKCQIYWWLSLSFYVKSLRTPWILNNQEKNTAYAGIGYSVSKIQDKSEIVIGCSHIYDSNGQGLKYKLSKIDNYHFDKQKNPYLSYKDAFQFGVSIRELFYQSLDKLPERVVIHKRTGFTDDEINGIKTSLNMAGIKKIDLIEINYEADARFVAMTVYQNTLQVDKFPISRGTCIVTNKHTALLWTHGIVPSVRQPSYKFYLGGRSIPAPIKITKHYGESNINTIATEILGLTKMNWNSLDLYSKLPSTIDSSNQIARIGKLLSRFEGKTYDYRLFI